MTSPDLLLVMVETVPRSTMLSPSVPRDIVYVCELLEY